MSRHFNPRSREGSDVKITKIEHNGKISIHAPAKGATKRNIAVEPVELHFNPRSREGSDTFTAYCSSRCKDFNPRSREGSDVPNNAEVKRIAISIHAPAKGATWQPYEFDRVDIISIHAPAKGATMHCKYQDRRKNNFNPRSREGSDPESISRPLLSAISIHAPAKGATDNGTLQNGTNFISIHAPAKGATI